MADLGDHDKRLLDEFQRDFPLTPRPYADIAGRVGLSEAQVLDAFDTLIDEGYVTRIGAVVTPNTVGASTLAAMKVPPGRLEEVADIVSAFAEVNHNYEREHDFNLWFVAAATDAERLDAVLATIADKTGLKVMSLPMLDDYHLDLGFPLSWT